MIKEIKKGDRFSHPHAGAQELVEFKSYDGKYHFTVDGSPEIGLIVDSEVFKRDFKYVSSKTEHVSASCAPIATFQNYSKEYLDNMQELQAFCDAMEPKDDYFAFPRYTREVLDSLDNDSVTKQAFEILNDGITQFDLGCSITTGIIDVDKDLHFELGLTKAEQQFEDVVTDTLKQCQDTMLIKGREYRRNNNPFHNFDKGVEISGKSREEVIWGFALKHFISIQDIRSDLRDGKLPSEELLNEKYGDMINYLLIEKASIVARIKGEQ